MRFAPQVAVCLAIALGGATSDVAAQDERPGVPEIACPRVSLTVAAGASAREVGLRITNVDPGDFTAHLRADLEVQRWVAGAWTRVSVAGLQLRERCEPVGEVVSLAPRASITIAPWTGMLGDAQCVCTRCAPAPAGRYRFVVHSAPGCFQPRQFESAPFDLPTR